MHTHIAFSSTNNSTFLCMPCQTNFPLILMFSSIFVYASQKAIISSEYKMNLRKWSRKKKDPEKVLPTCNTHFVFVYMLLLCRQATITNPHSCALANMACMFAINWNALVTLNEYMNNEKNTKKSNSLRFTNTFGTK